MFRKAGYSNRSRGFSLIGKGSFVFGLAVLGVSFTSSSVMAGLNATAFNATPQAINSGTLSLLLTNGDFGSSTSVGFATYASKMRPLDSFSRFVNYTTGADMGIASPTLTVAATGDLVMRDATYGLRVWVQGCTTPWAVGGLTCSASGTKTDVLGSSGSPVAISTLSSATALSSSFDLAAGAVNYLKYTISLPTKTETNTNGTISGYGAEGTIQGKAASITWTVTANQSATTADSNS